MSIEVLHDESRGLCCFYDSCAGRAFGPVMKSDPAFMASLDGWIQQKSLDIRKLGLKKIVQAATEFALHHWCPDCEQAKPCCCEEQP